MTEEEAIRTGVPFEVDGKTFYDVQAKCVVVPAGVIHAEKGFYQGYGGSIKTRDDAVSRILEKFKFWAEGGC